MLHKNSVFQAAMILGGLLTSRLAEAAGTPPAAQSTSPWKAAVACCVDSPYIGPVGRALSLALVVVGGLVFAFAKSQPYRTWATIVYGIGMLIGAANFLIWLFPL
jgi:type IV secretory pathway VirB2 component (pilin)